MINDGEVFKRLSDIMVVLYDNANDFFDCVIKSHKKLPKESYLIDINEIFFSSKMLKLRCEYVDRNWCEEYITIPIDDVLDFIEEPINLYTE